jgi:hypothetical protein
MSILSQIIAYAPNKIDTEKKAKGLLLAEVPRSEMDNFNTPDLEQSPASFLRPGETLEDFDVTFRRPNAQGGRIPFAKAKSVQKAPDRYGKFTGEGLKGMERVSDAILKSYADDDITYLFEKKKTNPKGLISAEDSKQGLFKRIKEDPSRIDFIIKNTGLDEDTIFDILDDRIAYLELEKERPTRPLSDKKIFLNKAEKWLTTNAKRYADPEKFEKAFTRTFGKNNLITKTIKANITDVRGKGRLGGFSDDFIKTIMATSQGVDPTKTSIAFDSRQLKEMFKTVIYNNNPNVRKKITTIFENIIPEPGSKRTPDIRNLFANNPTLKKFGLDKSIKGPIARLIANEINEDLLLNVKNFQKPFLGTDALLSFLKDRVDPKYKEMFREASNAVKQAQKNQWPQAKKTLNLSQSIMFDHKIPKSIIDLGYADEIEYIKLNPTSEKFNATIKRSQFDTPMNELIRKFEQTKTLDGKAGVVKEMNTLKNNFSKKYGGYLDEVTITPDKTGKPIFKSSAAPVTKKTDFVSSLGKSMTQTNEINKKQLNKLLKDFEVRGCGKASGGRILFSNGGEAITTCAKKGVAGFIDDLKKGNYSKATVNILKGGGNVLKNIIDPKELLKIRNYFGPVALGFMAAFEGGVITDDVIRQGTPLNESLANNWLTKSFLPYTQDYAKAKNLLESGTVPSNMKKYVEDVVTFNEGLKEMERIENMTSSRIADVGGYGMLDGSSMYSKKQEDKDVNNLIKKMSSISEDVITPGTAKALEMKALQDEMEATRMAKKEFSPIFGFGDLKDVRTKAPTGILDYMDVPDPKETDLRQPTYLDAEYENVKTLPSAERKRYEDFFTEQGILQPRQSLSELKFGDSNVYDEILEDYNKFQRQKEASKYPGYFGTQDKFMEGGIASLNVNKK